MSDRKKKKDGSLESIFDNQRDGELIEVDETGNLHHEGQSPQGPGEATNILGDPRGEYSPTHDFDALYPASPLLAPLPEKKFANIKVNKEHLFVGSDAARPRLAVEQAKVRKHFPGRFKFVKRGDVIDVSGRLKTNFNRYFQVHIHLTRSYPYSLPKITVEGGIDLKCPHVYKNGDICVMQSHQWSPVYGVSFLITKIAVWLNKYEVWCANGRKKWPGTDQHGSVSRRDPTMDYLRQNNLLRSR